MCPLLLSALRHNLLQTPAGPGASFLSLCEFHRASAMLCSEALVSLVPSIPSGSQHSFCILFHRVPSALGGRDLMETSHLGMLQAFSVILLIDFCLFVFCLFWFSPRSLVYLKANSTLVGDSHKICAFIAPVYLAGRSPL